MARTKFTTELGDAIVSAILHGATVTAAAEAVNVTRKTIYNWSNYKGDDEDFTHFTQSYARARKARPNELLLRIAEADDWRSDAWLLERLHGYTPKQEVAERIVINVNVKRSDAG